ncbi:MAG: hypothetical protein J5826_08420 [Bacteroidales bacterium]|nr:hypothetical protein [Bacteroidales bacterium]
MPPADYGLPEFFLCPYLSKKTTPICSQFVYIFKNAGAGFKTGKSELLPFPETVINLNKSLKQNPGW